MPAKSIDCEALPQFKELLFKFTEKNRLKVNWDKAIISATPRRLFAFIPNFPLKQEPAVTEIKGPPAKAAFKEGKATLAAIGFAESQGIKVDDLITKDAGAGKYVFAVKKEEGESSVELLKKELPKIIKSISFKKSMRWGNNLTFVRPIRWLCCLLGDKAIIFELDGLKSSRKTYGHRLLDNKVISLKNANQYFKTLQKAKVLLKREDRSKKIKKQLDAQAKNINGKIDWNNPRINQTFEEVINLVEWPTTIAGTFEKEFLILPDIVIETVLQSHQRYLPVQNSAGLMPYFLVVQNGNPKKNALIKQGHERVVRARLNDGMFFFEEDIKIPLNHRVEQLKGVTFTEKLGTMFDKQTRVKEISQKLADKLKVDEKTKNMIKETVPLLKADLTTSMVGEFAELQGSIGKEYAAVAGYNKTISQAIYEHYLPKYMGDVLPRTKLGSLLSVSDKLDTIVAHFCIGNIPTSAGDPFGLRRQGNGIVTVMLKNNFFIPLKDLIRIAYRALVKQTKTIPGEKQIIEQITGFMMGRLERIFSSRSVDYDIIRSLVLAVSLCLPAGEPDLADINIRAEALMKFRNIPKFDDLMTAYSRCLNLGKKEAGTKISEKRLIESREKAFYEALLKVENKNNELIVKRKYLRALENLANQRKLIDEFFDAVLVMDEDKNIRQNRLSLLNRFVTDCNEIADLSKLVVS